MDKERDRLNLVQFVLFQQLMYCPLCGCTLVLYPHEIKRCLQGCGQATVSDNNAGLPIVIFEVPA